MLFEINKVFLWLGELNMALRYIDARNFLVALQELHLYVGYFLLFNGHNPFLQIPQLAAEYSECPSGKKGGDLGWFPRGKMAGPFQDVAFSTPIGATSAPFKSTYVLAYIILFSLQLNLFQYCCLADCLVAYFWEEMQLQMDCRL